MQKRGRVMSASDTALILVKDSLFLHAMHYGARKVDIQFW